MTIREWIEIRATSTDEPILLLEGFDDALVGLCSRCGQPDIAIYDREKIIEILVGEGSTEEDARDHFSFNIIGGYVGEYTPAFVEFPPEDVDPAARAEESGALPPYPDSWALRNGL